MHTLFISELFLSIQGESSHAGRPCGFVRLAGCPLRCAWCDTAYAFHEGEARTIDEILAAAAAWKVSLVEVTGGEPLHQAAVHPLLTALCDRYDVLLETGGAHPIADVDPRVTIIMDVKCPGSGESGRNLRENLAALKPHDEVKFVLRDRADFDWACEHIRREPALRGRVPLLSPVHGELAPDVLAVWLLESGLHARLQLQLHKYLWPGVERGV